MNVVTTKSISMPIMEKEDIDKDAAKRYFEENKDNISLQVKTLSENGFEALAIGLMQHCLKVPTFSDDPSILPQLLILLNKTGKIQEFHDQCCELSCCKALKVVDWLRNQVKLADKQVLQKACEIFFLQNLLSPKKLCCTEQLLRSWLSCFHEEDSVSSIAVDNINKMLGVVESTQHLSLFLKAIYDEFGIKLLPLCTDLALRIFKMESPTVTVGGNPKQANVTLAQTVEIIGKLFRNFIPLYSECLLSSLLLDPSLERLWSVKDFYSGNCPLITPCKMLPVDIKIYNCILHSISTFRPSTLARMLTWHELKKLIIEQLHLQGFPIPNKFLEGENVIEDKTENGDVSDKESDKTDDGHDLSFRLNEVNEVETIDKTKTNSESKIGLDSSSNISRKVNKSKLNSKIDGPSPPMSQKRARKVSTKYAEEYETINNKLERKANKAKVAMEQQTLHEIVSPPKKKKLECNGDVTIEETIRVTRSMKPKSEADETEFKKTNKLQPKFHKKNVKTEEIKENIKITCIEPKKNLRQKKVTIGDDQIKKMQINKVTKKCKVIKPKAIRKLNIDDSKSVTPCVCDGCGEIVPDCSWLTAHIVTCSGRPQIGNTEEDEELEIQQNGNNTWSTENSSPKILKDPPKNIEISPKEDYSVLIRPSIDEISPPTTSKSDEKSQFTFETSKLESQLNSSINSINYAVLSQITSDNENRPVESNPLGKEISFAGSSMYEFQAFQCNYCMLVFYNETAMRGHTQYSDHPSAFANTFEIYCCTKCGLQFSNKQFVWYHNQYTCKGVSSPPTEVYRCFVCYKTFLSEPFLQRHLLMRHASESLALEDNLLQGIINKSHHVTSSVKSDSNVKNPSLNQQQISESDIQVTSEITPNQTIIDPSKVQKLLRRAAKGIMYKNVFMQCIVNYLCSNCKKDLSTKASKREHKQSVCFSNKFTYLRQYAYLCPYCADKFPSQKACRAHQLAVCLVMMGVKTDELNYKQLFCPFCDKRYFNIITLKGHMTLAHKVDKNDRKQLLNDEGQTTNTRQQKARMKKKLEKELIEKQKQQNQQDTLNGCNESYINLSTISANVIKLESQQNYAQFIVDSITNFNQPSTLPSNGTQQENFQNNQAKYLDLNNDSSDSGDGKVLRVVDHHSEDHKLRQSIKDNDTSDTQIDSEEDEND